MTAARFDGFDVYHGNAITDMNAVPTVPVLSHKASEGATGVDPLCAVRLPQFKSPRKFIYHWIRPDSSAVAQVANFNSRVIACKLLDATGTKIKPGYGIMLDWERTSDSHGVPLPFPTLALVNDIHAKLRAAYPGRLITYSAPWVDHFYEWRAANPTAPFWLADYSADSLAHAAALSATVLQYTNHAVVPGFATPIDGNMILNQKVLDGVCGLTNTVPLPPPPPIVNPPLPPEGDEMNVIVKVLVPNDPNNATYGAAFLGSMDSLGIVRDVIWSGRGDGPTGAKVIKRLSDYGARGVPTQFVNLSDLSNVNLIGNVPTGDIRTWSTGDFAPNV